METMEKLAQIYLRSNARGFEDGYVKADTHEKLIRLLVSERLHVPVESMDYIATRYDFVLDGPRKASRDLTDRLDEVIGFPLDRAPNYKRLVPEFISHFINLVEDWFDERPGLMSDQDVEQLVAIIARRRINLAFSALDSYAFEFVAGDNDFLTMRSLLGQVVTLKSNQFFGCSYTLDKNMLGK